MNILDNLSEIKKLDAGGVLASAELLASQLRQAWRECRAVSVPADFKKATSIVVAGMGGSALGAHVIASVFADQLRQPLLIVSGYQLPRSVDRNTLCIISSYSGTTEETVGALAQAKKRGAKVFVITMGGELGRLVTQGKVSGYKFLPNYNPSGQPRMGLGYSLGAQLALLSHLGFLTISSAVIEEQCLMLDKLAKKWGASMPTKRNVAKQLAVKFERRLPIVIGAEFLAGNAHVLANQINENAKTFSSYFILPELDHHLLEGLKFPVSNRTTLGFLFLNSSLYNAKNQQRYLITQSVLAKQGIATFNYRPSSTQPLGQALEVLAFGSYVSFYLAVVHRVNPSLIPWVDYFKSELKKKR